MQFATIDFNNSCAGAIPGVNIAIPLVLNPITTVGDALTEKTAHQDAILFEGDVLSSVLLSSATRWDGVAQGFPSGEEFLPGRNGVPGRICSRDAVNGAVEMWVRFAFEGFCFSAGRVGALTANCSPDICV